MKAELPSYQSTPVDFKEDAHTSRLLNFNGKEFIKPFKSLIVLPKVFDVVMIVVEGFASRLWPWSMMRK